MKVISSKIPTKKIFTGNILLLNYEKMFEKEKFELFTAKA